MRRLLALLICLGSISAQAQLFIDGVYYNFKTSTINYHPFNFHPNEGVKNILFTITTGNKKKEQKQYKKYYNTQGFPTAYYRIVEGAEEIWCETDYNENGMITRQAHYKKGELSYESVKTWNNVGKILSSKSTNKKGKINHYATWEYDVESECLLENVTYKKGGQQVNQTIKYEYYSPCQRSRSTLYNKKGKVVSEWTYDCKEEGEKLEKKKNETQICTWEETAGDYLLKVRQSFDEKGNTRKTVSKLNRSDSSLVEMSIFNKEDELVYHSTYKNGYKYPLKQTSYTKGNVYAETIRSYEGEKTIYEIRMVKGKLAWKREYSYAENGDLKKVVVYGKKGKHIRTIELEYTR